jgi:hypothetical protein
MYWLLVKLEAFDGNHVDNLINVDTIVRIGPRANGSSYMRFVDGSSVDLVDNFLQLKSELTKAKSV